MKLAMIILVSGMLILNVLYLPRIQSMEARVKIYKIPKNHLLAVGFGLAIAHENQFGRRVENSEFESAMLHQFRVKLREENVRTRLNN